jgi:ferredoxin/flavodoxin
MKEHKDKEMMTETRRDFIKKSALLCAWASLPSGFITPVKAAQPSYKTRDPKNALVLYYSQTGLTARYGRLTACTLKAKGLLVDYVDMQTFHKDRLGQYDLIIVGSPVFYYDIPSNVRDWLGTIPKITGTPVAAFVSFGGPEGNQRNAVCRSLGLLAAAGGVPAALGMFRSIPAYPTPAWDSDNQRSAEHLPDSATYDAVRLFSCQILERIAAGESIPFEMQPAVREYLRYLPLIWFNKKAISKHTVDAGKCISCGTCVKKCPVAAIRPEKQFVDRDKCLACFGCLNNCPADAVVMDYAGKRLYGFLQYLKRRKITILEPPEFQGCSFDPKTV